MNKKYRSLLVWVTLTCFIATAQAQNAPQATVWLTKNDRSALFEKQAQSLKFTAAANQNATITVNEGQTYQSIDGFGFALTGGSAQHIIHMSPASRADLLKNIFAFNENNIGVSY